MQVFLMPYTYARHNGEGDARICTEKQLMDIVKWEGVESASVSLQKIYIVLSKERLLGINIIAEMSYSQY